MTTRPASKAPTWAETSLYPSGNAAGTVTTLEPSDAIKGYGYVPGFKLGARRRNWLDRSAARWAKYHDGIEALNWSPVAWVGSNDKTKPVSLCTDSRGVTFLAIDENVYSSTSGKVWATKTIGAPSVRLQCIASAGDIVIAGSDEGVLFKAYSTSAGGNFTHHALTGVSPSFEAWDAVGFGSSVYLFGGADPSPGAHAPRIVQIDQALTATLVLSDAIPSGFSPSCKITLAAASPTRMVAAAFDADTDPAIWSSANGTAWTLVRPAGMTRLHHSLMWNPVDACFEMVSTTGEIWTSTDGTAWALRVAATTVIANQQHNVTLAGGLWLCTNTTLESAPRLCMSLDRGVTWSCLHYVHEEVGTYSGPGEDLALTKYSGGRFWSIQRPTNSTDPHSVVASMRLEV